MKFKNMKKEDLEILSYTDLTEMILRDNKKSMNTAEIFKCICNALEMSEEDYANKIGDYYTSLTTDKRFILLDNAEWDLKDRHKVEIVLDEEDDLEDEEDDFSEEENLEEETEEDMSESTEITDDEVDLDDEDDMEDLTIVEDEDLDV